MWSGAARALKMMEEWVNFEAFEFWRDKANNEAMNLIKKILKGPLMWNNPKGTLLLSLFLSRQTNPFWRSCAQLSPQRKRAGIHYPNTLLLLLFYLAFSLFLISFLIPDCLRHVHHSLSSWSLLLREAKGGWGKNASLSTCALSSSPLLVSSSHQESVVLVSGNHTSLGSYWLKNQRGMELRAAMMHTEEGGNREQGDGTVSWEWKSDERRGGWKMWVAEKWRQRECWPIEEGVFWARWVEYSHVFEPEGTHWLMKEKKLFFLNPLTQFCSQLHLLQICFDSRQKWIPADTVPPLTHSESFVLENVPSVREAESLVGLWWIRALVEGKLEWMVLPKGVLGKKNFKTTFVIGANKVSPILLWHNRTQKQKTAGNIAWQLLGELLIDGNAPGSVSIWTWLTWSYAKHSSLADILERDAQCQPGSILFRKKKHLGSIFTGVAGFCSYFKVNKSATCSNCSLSNKIVKWHFGINDAQEWAHSVHYSTPNAV